MLFVLASLSRVARADFGGLMLAGRLGSLSFGSEWIGNSLPESDGRFDIMFLPRRIDGINCDFDLKGIAFPLMLNWYPVHDGFHFSAGLIFNQTHEDLEIGSSASLMIGGHSHPAAGPGTIHGTVHFPRLAPYVGIGWGHAFGLGGRWGILGDLGMAFLGRPKVSLSAAGPIASDAKFMGDLAQEERDVQDDLSILRFYPIFSISLFYRF